MELDKATKDKIIDFFKEKPEVEAVYLYGSFSKGTAKEDSDIDLAVLVNNKDDFKGFDMPQTRYVHDLEKLADKKIEVQDMEAVSVDFAHRALSEGELLLGLNSKKRVEFEEKILRVYFDMKPFFDEYVESIHKIAKKGELGAKYI